MSAGTRQVVFRQARTLHYDSSGPIGAAAELDRTFRDKIDIILDIRVDFVEQLMQGDEIGPLHIPVCIFTLRLQIDCIGKPAVTQINDFCAGCFG